MIMIEHLISQIKAAKDQRTGIESIMRDCFDYTLPMLGAGLEGNPLVDGTSALYDSSARKSNNIYNATATDALRQLVSFIVSGMVPSNTRWFDLDVAQDPESRHPWLDETADTIWREIHASNFDVAIADLFTLMAIGGYGAMHQGMDADTLTLNYETWPIYQTYICESKAGGPADVVYRTYGLTAKQSINEFGADAVCESVRQMAAANSSKMLEFAHAIYPRDGGVPGGQAMQKPYASVHIDMGNRCVVRESGYDENPIAVPRWRKIANSPYATGPVYEALPDIKTLNSVIRFHLANLEMAAAGMWGAVDDGVINPSSIKIGPRQIVLMSSPDSMFPLNPPGNAQMTYTDIAMLEQQVRKTMLVDAMQLPQGGNQTATEINVRVELMRQLLGPVYGRLQSELLNNVVARAFGLLQRAGKIDPVPEELAGGRLNIRFISPLARAQRMGEVAAMDRFESGLMNLSQINPAVLDVYDFDLASSEKSWLLGVPQKLIRSQQKIKQLRTQRAQAQAQQQEQALQDEIAVQTIPKQSGA